MIVALIKEFLKYLLPTSVYTSSRRTVVKQKKKLLRKLLIHKVSMYFMPLFKLSNLRLISLCSIEIAHKKLPDKVSDVKSETITNSFKSPAIFNLQNNHEGNLKSIQYNYSFCKLSKVHVIGNSNLISLNDRFALYDAAFISSNSHVKLMDDEVFTYYGNQAFVRKGKQTRTIDKAIVLAGNFSWNYYHFFYEFISKIQYIEKHIQNQQIPLIVDEVVRNVPQYNEILNYFNKNREVIYVHKNERMNVSKAYYFLSPNVIPPSYSDLTKVKASDCHFNFDNLEFLRSRMLSIMSNKPYPKRIFITRRNAKKQRPLNEEALYTLFKKYNFEIVSPDEYTASEQVAMFNQAEYIVGGTGAAFTNILFCKPGCKVLCLSNYSIDISIFSTIASFVNVDFMYYLGKSSYDSKCKLHDPFSINVEVLENKLDQFFLKNQQYQ